MQQRVFLNHPDLGKTGNGWFDDFGLVCKAKRIWVGIGISSRCSVCSVPSVHPDAIHCRQFFCMKS